MPMTSTFLQLLQCRKLLNLQQKIYNLLHPVLQGHEHFHYPVDTPKSSCNQKTLPFTQLANNLDTIVW